MKKKEGRGHRRSWKNSLNLGINDGFGLLTLLEPALSPEVLQNLLCLFPCRAEQYNTVQGATSTTCGRTLNTEADGSLQSQHPHTNADGQVVKMLDAKYERQWVQILVWRTYPFG